MPEIKGREVRSTAKAVFFHRYGDKEPQWLPHSQIRSRRQQDNGTLVLSIPDWLYDQVEQNAEPGDLAEQPVEHPELELEYPFGPPPNGPPLTEAWPVPRDKELSVERQPIRYMTDKELCAHFDNVVAELHDRGIDIEHIYRGKQ